MFVFEDEVITPMPNAQQGESVTVAPVGLSSLGGRSGAYVATSSIALQVISAHHVKVVSKVGDLQFYINTGKIRPCFSAKHQHSLCQSCCFRLSKNCLAVFL
jgi:hypothetical protein